MTNNQINRKEMHDSVLAYLDNNADKWARIPKVGEFKLELAQANQHIEEASANQEKARVRIGRNKTALKRNLAEKADIVNDQLECMAAINGDQELENRMAKSFHELFKMRNADLVTYTKETITEADKNAKELTTEYGLTKALLNDLKNDFNTFSQMNGMPREYQIKSSVATTNLEELFKETNELLSSKLDKVMKVFKRSDSNFYNGYLAARTIVD